MAIRRIWLVVPLPGTDNRNTVDVILERRNRDNGRDNEMRNPATFHSEEDAIRHCETLATQNPLKPYAVMGIVAIRETVQPTVIAKQFTNDGELIPV